MSDIIEIDSAEKFNNIRNGLGKSYKLTKDIDLKNLNPRFTPVGTPTAPFTGKLDGNGYTIMVNMYMPGNDNIGVFGVCRDAVITNLFVEGRVLGFNNIGGIVGVYSGSDKKKIINAIKGCQFKGEVLGSKNTGGIVAKMENALLTDCCFSGEIVGTENVGGIVGYLDINIESNNDVIKFISKCCHIGEIKHNNYENKGSCFGGIIGQYESHNSPANNKFLISDCYHVGNITGWIYLGGIFGQQRSFFINNCYSIGNIKSRIESNIPKTIVGGISTELLNGEINNSMAICPIIYIDNPTNQALHPIGTCSDEKLTDRIKNCFAWADSIIKHEKPVETCANIYDFEGVGFKKINDLFFNLDFYVNELHWDFEKTWIMPTDDYPFPKLRLPEKFCQPTEYKPPADYIMGDGSKNNPFLISTYEQLDAVRKGMDKHYKLMVDLDFAKYRKMCSQKEGWKPIGSSLQPFNGYFDGRGHRISGLFIECEDMDDVGLFGAVGKTGIVSYLVISGSVTGRTNVGLFAGYNMGIISNCVGDGTVRGSYNAGVIAGTNQSGKISNCYTTRLSAVSGKNKIGGIVGENCGNIERCYTRGYVSGIESVGGIAGINYTIYDKISIRECAAINYFFQVQKKELGGRIAGENYAECFNNYACDQMKPDGKIDDKNGANKSASELHSRKFWEDGNFWGADCFKQEKRCWVWGGSLPIMHYENYSNPALPLQ